MRIVLLLTFIVLLSPPATGQVDTILIYNEGTAYGTLDLRLRKSETHYYYLREGKTFSFRKENGQRTDNYLHMNAWETSPYEQGQLRERIGDRDRFVMNYRFLKPENIQSNAKYPIVFFLHGIQESGNCVDEKCLHGDRNYDPNDNSPPAPEDSDFPLYNNDYNLLHGGRNYLNARNRAGGRLVDDPALHERAFPGYAVFPQSNNGWSAFEIENALRLLRLIIKKYNIDENRVYLNGLSKGGYGAFEAMKRAPWLFAAAALFSPISDANIITLKLEPTIQHIPLWIFQGGQDLAPTPKDTEGRIRNFRRAGMSVRYTFYPHLGHATWNEAMEEPDFFRWLLGYTNNRIHVFGGNESICQSGSDGLQLTMPPGFAEYEWQVDGSTINTGNENHLAVTESGSYRGRFRFSDTGVWNTWSKEVSIGVNSPERAEFVQHGTLHLPDLNGKNEATLEATGEHSYYRWFKGQSVIDLPGDMDDTLRLARIPSDAGSGYYSLSVADFGGCYSPRSEERRIYFNNESSVNMNAPASFQGQSQSPSAIDLTWEDNADGEDGFEIWRRSMGPEGTSPWRMATITSAGAESFKDAGLEPETTYEYRIRAVSENGRSTYSPEERPLQVETARDVTPPAKPIDVTAELSYVNTIKVRWRPATDDSSIRGYELTVNGETINTQSTDTIYFLEDLNINTAYTIRVAAIDAGNNVGAQSAPVTVSTNMEGLFYRHTTGAWEDLKSIDWSVYEYEGMVPYFDLSPKVQEDFFNFRFDGFLKIGEAGSYEFRISSNDGSSLSLNGDQIAENDGIHDLVTITSSAVDLGAGPQRITVDFFDHMEADSLLVEYRGPDTGNEWTSLGAESLKSSSEGIGEIDIDLYPNPSSGSDLNVVVRGSFAAEVNVTITDIMGRKVKEYHGLQGPRFTLTDLDLQDGVYILTVSRDKATKSRRFVCVRP